MSAQTEAMLVQAKLNRAQRKFCKSPVKKNIRLLAPAGSGKTYSILWRCRCLIEEAREKGVSDPRVLIVTFTRGARLELESRINEAQDFLCLRENVTVSTLNAWGWKRIKPDKKLIGTQKELADLVIHDLKLVYSKKFPAIEKALSAPRVKYANAKIIITLIDLLKTLGFTHKMGKRDFLSHVKHIKELGLYYLLENGWAQLWKIEAVEDEDKAQMAAIDDFFSFWKKAILHLKSEGKYTLEDQKYWARMALDESIEEGSFPQGGGRYTHVFIDEFQDVNPLDIALIKSIATYHGHGKPISLTIVGDDDQAIFGWRGTTPKYILNPEKFFEVPFETYILDTNYRSPTDIVEPSKKLISYNKNRVVKDTKSAAKGRAYVKIINKKRLGMSIEAVLSIARKTMASDDGGTIALIGRKQAALFPYEVLLSAENIPYRVDADIDIFDGEAMQALLNIMYAIDDAHQGHSRSPVQDLLNICNFVGKYPLKRSEQDSISDALARSRVRTLKDAIEKLQLLDNEIQSTSVEKLIKAAEALLQADTAFGFMQVIQEQYKGFDKDFNKRERDNHYKEPQFFRITELSRQYGSDIRRLADDISYAQQTNDRNRRNDDVDELSNDRYVELVTATRSKGHEYDVVVILDVFDGEWPSQMSDDREEERRLFYVAMTRARHYLYFVTSDERDCSRFLLETGLC